MWSLDSRLLLLMQISQESKLGPLYRLCLSTVKYAPEVVVEAKMLVKKKKIRCRTYCNSKSSDQISIRFQEVNVHVKKNKNLFEC